MDLPRECGGISEFTIDGMALGETVQARWDGETLVMPSSLYGLFRLSLAVEELFVESGLEEPWLPCDDTPYGVAIEIIRSLDHLINLNYCSAAGARNHSWPS